MSGARDDPRAGRSGGPATEQVDPRYARIDLASVRELATLMNEADATVPAAVRAAMDQIVPAIEAIADAARGWWSAALRRCGLRGPDRRPGRIRVRAHVQHAAGHGPGHHRRRAGGDRRAQRGSRGRHGGGGTVVERAGHRAGGRRGRHRRQRSHARMSSRRCVPRAAGALTVSLSCNRGAPLSGEAALPIEVLVGPEVLAGSTRLKAGTAQKLVLNMISTIAMVRLGKTYGNLMVDLRATNAKLRERALRIVQAVTGADRDAGRRRAASTPDTRSSSRSWSSSGTSTSPRPDDAGGGARPTAGGIGGRPMKVLGMISGTSHDGIDAAIVELHDTTGDVLHGSVVHAGSTPYEPALRAHLLRTLPPASLSLLGRVRARHAHRPGVRGGGRGRDRARRPGRSDLLARADRVPLGRRDACPRHAPAGAGRPGSRSGRVSRWSPTCASGTSPREARARPWSRTWTRCCWRTCRAGRARSTWAASPT